MDELPLGDPTAQRLARFFADLMLTLGEDGVGGEEAAEARAGLWHSDPGHVGRGGADLDLRTVVHGLGAVAAALAGQLAVERRATGRACATAAEVWDEVGRALDSRAPYDSAPGNGTVHLT